MNKTLFGAGVLLASLDAGKFLQVHGNSLSEVLHVVAGNHGLDIYCEADRLLDDPSPDPLRVGMALRRMRDLLAGAEMPGDRHVASLRWHGARLNDLAERLPC